MATYVMGDIHNSKTKLELMLEKISFGHADHIFLLGDLFDRGGSEPDPVGVYFKVCEMASNITWIRGNHDQLLAEYIFAYFGVPENKRDRLKPYPYNSFELIMKRLVEVDMLKMANLIKRLPLQVVIEIGSEKYLMAHAMTFDPAFGVQAENVYLEGCVSDKNYWNDGVEGYISFVGHRSVAYQSENYNGRYLDEKISSIWENEIGNLYMLDCGCGLPGGKLACMCLENGERFYI